jgi:FtsP/CotA-like multicopper oxidase with cupredoxin domain
VRGSDVPPLRMRYVKFKGKFVIHCHILDHEDRGMMQLVEIID